jgi:hypothetical protein
MLISFAAKYVTIPICGKWTARPVRCTEQQRINLENINIAHLSVVARERGSLSAYRRAGFPCHYTSLCGGAILRKEIVNSCASNM